MRSPPRGKWEVNDVWQIRNYAFLLVYISKLVCVCLLEGKRKCGIVRRRRMITAEAAFLTILPSETLRRCNIKNVILHTEAEQWQGNNHEAL